MHVCVQASHHRTQEHVAASFTTLYIIYKKYQLLIKGQPLRPCASNHPHRACINRLAIVLSQGYSFFSFLLIYNGLGVGFLVSGLLLVLLGSMFSVFVVWGLWCGAFWVFGVGALYINIEEWPRENNFACYWYPWGYEVSWLPDKLNRLWTWLWYPAWTKCRKYMYVSLSREFFPRVVFLCLYGEPHSQKNPQVPNPINCKPQPQSNTHAHNPQPPNHHKGEKMSKKY